MEKSKYEKMQEKLCNNKKSSWTEYSEKEKKEIFSFADQYKRFMAENKTERACVKTMINMLEKNNFKDIDSVKSAKANDRFYKVFKKKALLACIVGKNSDEWRLIGSHIDSPRLDLKPSPLYEDARLALLKTHYYGGVKKYHWVNTPLALHGTIITKQGKEISLCIGEKENEPKFIIPDLLPHLARDQMERKASRIVEGEELNILFGNIPVNDDKIKEQVKLAVLNILHDEYGMVEEDFLCAEFELVPAGKPTDIGIDRSMIGAYAHDDKVCAYTSLMALLTTKNPAYTAVCMFVDKEEIGSDGDTGASSFILKNFAEDYAQKVKCSVSASKILETSKSLSADVTAAQDPNFKDANDPLNVSYLGLGISIEKYGGGGGKYATHDAHAEYMGYLRKLCDAKKIPWQTGELGRIDIGGGGTIAKFMSCYGMDCVDAGPAVLGMHSPCEVASKADIYSAYRFYCAFLLDGVK